MAPSGEQVISGQGSGWVGMGASSRLGVAGEANAAGDSKHRAGVPCLIMGAGITPPGKSETSTSGRCSKGRVSGVTGRVDWVVENSDWAWHDSSSDNSPFMMCVIVGA